MIPISLTPRLPSEQGSSAWAAGSTAPKTFWENINENNWGRYISEVEKTFLVKADSLCGQKGVFLEIGCDGGRWVKLLVDRGWRAICTDINPESLDRCQKRVSSANCILVKPEDATLPCASHSLSLILCVEVIPVIAAEWFLAEASRVLAPGGYLVGVFNNRRSLRGAFSHWAGRRSSSFDWYAVGYPEWKATLQKRGFQMVEETGLCWFPFSRQSNHPLVPFCVRLEALIGLRRLVNISPWVVFLAQKKPGR